MHHVPDENWHTNSSMTKRPGKPWWDTQPRQNGHHIEGVKNLTTTKSKVSVSKSMVVKNNESDVAAGWPGILLRQTRLLARRKRHEQWHHNDQTPAPASRNRPSVEEIYEQHHRCHSHTKIQIEIAASLNRQGAKPSCLPNEQKPQRRKRDWRHGGNNTRSAVMSDTAGSRQAEEKSASATRSFR